ncbi:hypothetical protein PENSPDRAFT_682389 [Peniophora sp. CONT]|nr:hypothetical protein PENSPDRAFT_682389 [Peniophora sp. CONT]
MPPKRKAAEESTTKAAKKTKVAAAKAPSKPVASKASKKAAPPAKDRVALSPTPTAKTITEPQTKESSVVTDPASASSKSLTKSDAEPVYSGKFDWYSTFLPFLHREYLPAGTRKPRYPELYATLLKFQAKPDFSGRFALSESGATGAFACSQIVNPFSDEALEDPVYVLNGEREAISIGSQEMPKGQEGAAGTFENGYRCDLEMDVGASGECGASMISKVGGTLKMRRVWSDGDKELFEGYVKVIVTHGATLRRKGHGPSSSMATPIWAIRARRDEEGEEIGIDEGDGSYFGGGGGYDDLDLDDDDEEDDYGGCRYGADDDEEGDYY